MRAAPLLIALALTGCAPRYTWVRADATQGMFDQDMARCQYEAASSTANYGSSTPAARTVGGSIGQGLALGYGQAMAENNLIALCMRAKGYAQAPIGQQPYPVAQAPVYAPPAPSPAPAAAKGESKYLFAAEALAKGSGCQGPAATMRAKGAGGEWFDIACQGGPALPVSCDVTGCRVLQ